ncbi:MAG: SMC-Scp complex subunit ScpB [Negativicutes bacterium]|jgi:segregation and condensation protein B
MFKNSLMAELEALLFVAGSAIPVDKLEAALELTTDEINELLSDMERNYLTENRGIMLRKVAGGVQLCTKPEFSQLVAKLTEVRESRLSNAALEVLAIVAFKQPITRQEIEAFRGVNSDKIVVGLHEKKLIEEVGRREAPGKPMLYGTTETFLYCFGLNSLNDLELMTFQQQSLL